MKPMIAMRLLGSLAFVLGAAVPAWAQEPAKEFRGWLCELDLSQISLPPEYSGPLFVWTFDSTKRCPGNFQGGQSESVTTECLAVIPNWTGSASTNKVDCEVDGAQCGVTGGTVTDASLNIDSAGNARLFCNFNPPNP
jgi:hypothetical protein